MNYPEHNKLKEKKQEALIIGEFLEDLDSKGIVLIKYTDSYPFYEKCKESINSLIANHFNIDQDLLEKEKEQMLDELAKIFSQRDLLI